MKSVFLIEINFVKVPTLRNIEKTFPYFHEGSIANLKQAVSIMAKTQLTKYLTEAQVNEVVAFLNFLTGKISADALVDYFLK